jgi:hypothetical protein
MNLPRCILLLLLLETGLSRGQSGPLSKPSDLPDQSETLVRNFYQQVVARHPHDIPVGADMKIFAPYLSKALLHRIDLAKACSADWDRENPEPRLKAEVASSYGLFSGEGVEADPRSFQIEKTQFEKDGSLQVFVRLTWKKPSERPHTWRVVAVVLREDGRYEIDDVIYVNDSIYVEAESKPADRRLSDYLSAGCNGPHWIAYSLPNQPETLARSLYQQVVARRPVGIPWGADWKIFAPYLSKTLLHRIDLAVACGDDWDRQDQKRMLMKDQVIEKAPLAWLELGIFSGGDEEDALRSFKVERTEPEKNGSFYVHVMLSWGWSPEKPWTSHVAAILIQENGRIVVDDVTYLKDNDMDVEYRLSKALSEGCDGPHWVGYDYHQNDQKPQQK